MVIFKLKKLETQFSIFSQSREYKNPIENCNNLKKKKNRNYCGWH